VNQLTTISIMYLKYIAPKVEMVVKPERNPNYYSDGVTVFLHWVKGHSHSRHVRVACAMQLAKDIVH
jgi:hypothetical protein